MAAVDEPPYPIDGLLEITVRPQRFWEHPPEEQARIMVALLRIPMIERLDIDGREREFKVYVRLTMLRDHRVLEQTVRDAIGP